MLLDIAPLKNVLITIPIDLYHILLGRCTISSKEYRILKNGVATKVESDDSDDQEVKVLCRTRDAESIIAWAKEIYPEASSRIVLDLHPDRSFKKPHAAASSEVIKRVVRHDLKRQISPSLFDRVRDYRKLFSVVAGVGMRTF